MKKINSKAERFYLKTRWKCSWLFLLLLLLATPGLMMGQTTYLSDLSWTSATVGWSTIKLDKSIDEGTLTVAGTTYSKGIGTHAISEIVYNLDGTYNRFQAVVGIDDEVDPYTCGNVNFQVYGDNVLIYESGNVNYSSAAKTIDVDVTGKTTLKLTVTDGGDGNSCDHADWADAKLVKTAATNTITARGDNAAAGEGIDKLTDGSTTTKWLDFSATSWVQFQYSSAKTWNKYEITSGNDYPERDPKNWTIQGSNNGTSWTTLDTRSNETWSSRNQTRSFTFTNTTAYTYYRWNITANGSGSIIQASEFTFGTGTTTTYTLNVTAANGSVSKSPNQATYNSGTSVTLTATANSGYEFSGWSGDASGSTNPLTVTMNANKNITANFTSIQGNGTLIIRARRAAGTGVARIFPRLDNIDGSAITLTDAFADYTISNLSGSKNVKVYFEDQNNTDAEVDYIIVNGITYQSENQATNTSVWQNDQCGGSYSQKMDCGGYIDFGTLSFDGTNRPPAPTNVSASYVTQTSADICWTAVSGTGISYEVFAGSTSKGTTTSTCLNISLACGTTNSITVKASNTSGTSDASAAINVTTQDCPSLTKVNHIGINPQGNLTDWNIEKPFADAMKTHRPWGNYSSAIDSKGWPTQDGQVVVWADLVTHNNNGTYQLYFNGQADINAGGEASISNKSYDAANNLTTATLVITDPENRYLAINFTNTKRTASSATNTGVTNVKLMRPVSKGSTQSYPTTQVFTNQFMAALAPFEAIRFMDWTSTNACGDSLWSDRTPWDYATQQPMGIPGRTYGWQGRGGAWESVILLCNATGKDAWICVPHKATEDYITQLANLFKNGNSALGVPPLNSNLNLYVEYSNEIWNWAGAFTQTPWCRDIAKTYGMPINFDGSTDEGTLLHRYKAMRTVRISEIFRSVFGDAAMMSRVRPVLMWQQNYNDLTNRTLNFIDAWYNKRDLRSTVATPHPVNFYIYGGGGSTYWDQTPSNGTVTIDNIWSQGSMVASYWENNVKKSDASWAAAFGIKNLAYEGGAIENYQISDALKHQAEGDARMEACYVEHQKAWNHVDGDLNMYFNLSSGDNYGLSILRFVDDLTTPKWNAINTMKTATPESVSQGSLAPFSRPGNAFDCYSWEAPQPNATGYVTLNLGAQSAYTFRVANDGTYNVQIEYSTTAASTLIVEFAGNAIATYNLGNTNGALTLTSFSNITCATNKLYAIRLVCTSGSVKVNSINVGTGLKSATVDALVNAVNNIIDGSSEFQVYPNPASPEKINLAMSNYTSNEELNISIVDINGRVLLRKDIQTDGSGFAGYIISDDIRLSNGIYFVSVKGNNGIKTSRLIVQ